LYSLAIVLMMSAAAHATTAITLTGYTDFSNGSQYTLGFEFSPVGNIDVTSLGSFFPEGADDTHGVTLWDTSGDVLATTTVTGNGSEGFLFSAITPLLLTGGTDYVIGATTLTDDYADQDATFTADPGITYLGHQETVCTGVTPCFPGTGGGFDFDDFGANFQFTSAVPEPGSGKLGLSGLAAFGLLYLLRKKPAAARP